MNRPRMSAVLLASTLLLVACGGSDLKADDPAGYEACALFAKSADTHGDPLAFMGTQFEIGKHAHKAATESIRNSATPLANDTWLVDDTAMSAACEENGVDVP